MSYAVTKILWGVAQPGNALVVVLALGAWLLFSQREGRRRAGRRMVAVATAGFLAFTVIPLGFWVVKPLENRFSKPDRLERVDGIIMLGGATNPRISAERGEPSLNDAGERILAMAALGRLYPDARLVFSGDGEEEGTRAALAQAGLDTGRVLFENKSRNTWENGLFSHALVAPKPGETWLLITSAWHMPRAIGIFRRIGWPVLPYPVDYRSRTSAKPYLMFGLERNLDVSSVAFREWAGLVTYRLLDRTDTLFPAP